MVMALQSSSTRLHLDLPGCVPGRTYPHIDIHIGLGLVCRVDGVYHGRRVLQVWTELLSDIGHTFEFWVLGTRNIVTDEPENVKD